MTFLARLWRRQPLPVLPLAPKRRFRVRADGWVRHDGGPCPVPPDCFVELILACGVRCSMGKHVERADRWPPQWWTGNAGAPGNNIVAFRPVQFAPLFPDPFGASSNAPA